MALGGALVGTPRVGLELPEPPNPPLAGPGFVLRPACAEDADFLYEGAQDPAIQRHFPGLSEMSRENASLFARLYEGQWSGSLLAVRRDTWDYVFIVEDDDEGTPLGRVRLSLPRGGRDVEMDRWFVAAGRNRPAVTFGTMRLAGDWARETFGGRVYAIVAHGRTSERVRQRITERTGVEYLEREPPEREPDSPSAPSPRPKGSKARARARAKSARRARRRNRQR